MSQPQPVDEELLAAEERMRLAQEVARIGTFEWNMQTGVNRWSPELEAMYGLPRGGFPGSQEAWEQLVYEDDRTQALRGVQLALERGEFEGEWRVRWPDGTLHWLAGRARVFRDAAGRPLRLLGVNIDITDRKKAEEELRERTVELSHANVSLEARARQLRALAEAALVLNAAPSFAAVLAALPEQARHVIGAHQAVTSYTTDLNWGQSLLGLSLSDKYAAYRDYDVKPDGTGIYALVCETNRPMRLTQAELEAHPRWRAFGKEAERHPAMRGWLAAPFLGAGGRNLGLIQVSDKYEGDFTEEDEILLTQLAQLGSVALTMRKFQEELEARVQERTAEVRFLNDLLEQATQPFATADFQGRILRFNRSFEKLTGYTAKELRGMYYNQLTPAKWHAVEKQLVEEVQRTGQSQHYEKEYVRKDGTLVPLELVVDLYRNSAGEPECLYAFVTDITERKRAEEQLRQATQELARSNAELEQFAYIASHDLQEPLRKVQAFGDLLVSTSGTALDEQGKLYVERMQNAAGRMQRLINDLLTFSRLGSQPQSLVAVDLGEVAREVAADLEGRLASTGGRIDIGTLPRLVGDPTQLRQLLQNLLGNALKFHRPDVPPVVALSGRIVESGAAGPLCEISVVDNGIGFELKYLDRIFAPFQRLHGQGKYEGTGMGLAICRKIVERQGGTITAHSTPGQGSTFVVTLPAHQPKGARHG